MKKSLKFLSISLLGILTVYAGILIFIKPANNRDWSDDQKILPFAEINDNLVSIHNIRNFRYTTETEYTPGYYNKTFDLNKIKSVDFILEPFSEFAGAAHTFLSFGFEDKEYVVISVEIRKEKGEEFSPVLGLLNQYEIMYVIADEKDAVMLRSNYRKDKVYVYPGKTTKEKIQALFLDMIKKTNTLLDKPEFYNTLTDTCTTNLMAHINKITPKRIPFSYKVLMPGYSDQLAFDLGLIDTDLTLAEARNKFLINERAEIYKDSENFSEMIRK